jgi:hypothetical protein
LALIFAFNIVMPILALCMDRITYGKIKDLSSEDRDIVNGVARNLGVPVEMVVYQRYQYSQYAKV